MYKLVLDKPGERPATMYLTREQAFNIAHKHILMPGMLTIYNDDGYEIYRHAQPLSRHSRARTIFEIQKVGQA